VSEFKVQAVVDADRSVTVRGLPFQAGDAVEVVIVPNAPAATDGAATPLHGSVLRYDNPTEPIGANDWEAAR
jgi:hypothetical protein